MSKFQFYYYFFENYDDNPRIDRINGFHVRTDRTKYFDEVPVLLLQLLYESQNTTLCPILAKSIKNHSLCLQSSEAELLSLFDWMCLSYFINNSNHTSWNHLHLGLFSNQKTSVFTAGLTNTSLQAHRLAVVLDKPTDDLIYKLLKPSLLHNIQECYCNINNGRFVPCLVLVEFLNLPQLTKYFIRMVDPTIPTIDDTAHAEKCSELEKCIEKNSKITQMMVQYIAFKTIRSVTSVMRGVAKNKVIKSFALQIHDDDTPNLPPLPDGVLEQLLKDNNTIQALLLYIPNERLPSSLNIVEVNTPLTALQLGWSSKLMTPSLLPHIKGLHCLEFLEPYTPHLLFHSHPNLHVLTLQLDTAESAIEVFTILQTNTTLKALTLDIKDISTIAGTSLQDMLTQNQTLKYLEFCDIPTSLISFLTTGLRNNTSLEYLSVPIPVNEESRALINVISQKNNLTELQVTIKSYSSCSDEEKEQIVTPLLYEQVLPAVTDMFQSHTTIKKLYLLVENISKESSQPHWKEIVQRLYQTIFTHPSLEYVLILAGLSTILVDTLDDQRPFIDRLRQEQPHKQIPIVDIH